MMVSVKEAIEQSAKMELIKTINKEYQKELKRREDENSKSRK